MSDDDEITLDKDGKPVPVELDFKINPQRAWLACKRYKEMGYIVPDGEEGLSKFVDGALDEIRKLQENRNRQAGGMTVGELIARLQEMPQDLKVWIAIGEGNRIHNRLVEKIKENAFPEVILS
jgi:hypothetical protein